MTVGKAIQYQGRELELFAYARRWKAYWASAIAKWIRGDVLEVGAGLGTNTLLLQNAGVRSWHCVEPDPALAARLASAIAHLPACKASRGTIQGVADKRFDSILYLDVLEHIEADREELALAARLLRPAGHIVVLSPAHQFLFSRFDTSIGHYRRYNRSSLRACSPAACRLEAMFYLDCAGVFLSFANRLLLGQDLPSPRQIQTWDNYVVPISRVLDPVFGHHVGKTLVGVWARRPERSGSADE